MTIFDVSIPGFPLLNRNDLLLSEGKQNDLTYLNMNFVEADGQAIKKVSADEFRIGTAETYDVIIEPKEDKIYTIFAESIDRSGYARATLSPNQGLFGKIPKMRPRTVLTMDDMAMDNMDMGGMEMNKEINDSKSGWADLGSSVGNKALNYSDLISLHPQKDLREPTREIEFHFGGNINRYIWTINGEKFPAPIHLKYGERVRLKFINETMMAHPIHLHGMFMQLENAKSISLRDDGGKSMKWLPNKHTVIVPPAQTISVLLTADEAGEWAFHCHLLFHMASGMMTSFTVDRNGK